MSIHIACWYNTEFVALRYEINYNYNIILTKLKKTQLFFTFLKFGKKIVISKYIKYPESRIVLINNAVFKTEEPEKNHKKMNIKRI